MIAFFGQYWRDALAYVGRPLAYPAAVDERAGYIGFFVTGITFTVALMLVGFNLAPSGVVSVIKPQLASAPFVLFLQLAECAIVASLVMLGAGPFTAGLKALAHTFGVIVPTTTLILVTAGVLFSNLLGTNLLVFAPLLVRITDPLAIVPAAPLAAAFLAIHAILFVMFAAATARALSLAYGAPLWRGGLAAIVGIVVVLLLSVWTFQAAALLYPVFGPLIGTFLKGA